MRRLKESWIQSSVAAEPLPAGACVVSVIPTMVRASMQWMTKNQPILLLLEAKAQVLEGQRGVAIAITTMAFRLL